MLEKKKLKIQVLNKFDPTFKKTFVIPMRLFKSEKLVENNENSSVFQTNQNL